MKNLQALSDSELFALLCQSNQLAFDEIFHRYFRSLFMTAFKVLKDENLVQPIIKSVFSEFWNNRHSYTSEDPFPEILIKSTFRKMMRYQFANPPNQEFINDLSEYLEKEKLSKN